MLLGDLLGKPIIIDDQDVILVDDHIGDSTFGRDQQDGLIEIEPPDGISPGFYIEQDSLMAARTSYPDHTPYGLWQTLYRSGMLSGAEILFLPFDEGSGRYARLLSGEDGWVPLLSGFVTGGELSEDQHISLDDAHRLNVDPSLLVLPKNPALLHREREALLQKRTSKRYWTTGIICVSLLATALLIESVARFQHSSAKDTVEALREQQRDLDRRIGNLTQSRLITRPDYSQALERIFHLHTIDPRLATAQSSTFKDEIVLMLDRNSLPFLRSFDWVVPEVAGNGSIVIGVDGRASK